MNKQLITTSRVLRRKRRVSIEMVGSADRPRISVSRSARFVYAQAIDDAAQVTLCAMHSKKAAKAKKSEQAFEVGKMLGEALKAKGITKAIFDRGAYTYLGRVKRLAEGLRESGIQV